MFSSSPKPQKNKREVLYIVATGLVCYVSLLIILSLVLNSIMCSGQDGLCGIGPGILSQLLALFFTALVLTYLKKV